MDQRVVVPVLYRPHTRAAHPLAIMWMGRRAALPGEDVLEWLDGFGEFACAGLPWSGVWTRILADQPSLSLEWRLAYVEVTTDLPLLTLRAPERAA